MLLVDTHCHIDSLNGRNISNNEISNILETANLSGVKIILAVSTSIHSFYKTIKLTKKCLNIYYSCGIHPLHIHNYNQNDLKKLQSISEKKNVIAIGETGLDYYYETDKKKLQQTLFKEHINIAIKVNKPIIIHSRKSSCDIVTILKEKNIEQCQGILHCFNESTKIAKKLLDLGLYISFSGIITFKNSNNLRKTLQYVPLNRLLIETDSPYLSPIPYRGRRNQPAYLRNIAEYIAQLKNVKIKELAYVTTKNFYTLFKLKYLKQVNNFFNV